VPAIVLPKDGGAIHGMGEKFTANPVTGTGSMSVPIATSPGRSGFGPELSLSYDSGAGNGPFGFGWTLSLPAIARKTDKGLPAYLDSEESDVFMLSGTDDLVPALTADGSRHRDVSSVPGYRIERYRPRIEGAFERIERWTRSDGDVHWRSISRDNVLTLYGSDASSRIADPTDPRRIFSWLINETRDDKGNAILYQYKAEDGIGCVLARSCERNRGGAGDLRRTANRYLKRVLYGNRAPLLEGDGGRPRFLADLPGEPLTGAEWMFELVLDYGEHDPDSPTPGDGGDWRYRLDPFSSYRSSFEIRTARLCRRFLMFHHIPAAGGVPGYDGLVRSTSLTHSDPQSLSDPRDPSYTRLRAIAQSGHRRRGDGSYASRSLPPVEFDYSEPVVQDRVELVDADSLQNLPVGVDGIDYRWTDLHGEGIPGILAERARAFFYKRNLSPIADRRVAFGPVTCVAEKPNLALAGGAQFMDLAGDGRPDLVVLDGSTPGFFEHDEEEGWENFLPFTARLNRDTRDPSLRFIDLNGDGRADILITDDDSLVWHPSLGEKGFGAARRVRRPLDEEKGPRLVFANESEAIHLADMSGDGLVDLVRVRNGEVCYWPNLGYGRFGAKVAMDDSPFFDTADQFDHRRIRLGDVDGTGTSDLLYLHGGGVRLYFNRSGNGWSRARTLTAFPRVEELAAIELVDLLGNGTTCLVWSSPLPADSRRPMRYVNLMGGRKPHLLVRTVNNLGAETRVDYAPSTRFYLQDELEGRPWLTRLPFPVHLVDRVETIDHIARNRFVTRYAYHHGYFDGEEREFRGFGMVEQWDTAELAVLTADGILPTASNLDVASHVPPVLTRTWFHTGVYLGRDRISHFFAGFLSGQDAGEYYREPPSTGVDPADLLLADTLLPPGLTVEEEREACRALKGSMLRQEVYARDGGARQDQPYTVVEQNFGVRREQPRGGGRHGVFFTHPRETITYHYEREPADPRVQHALTLEVDSFGNTLKEATIGYGRRQASLTLAADKARQAGRLVTYSEHRFTDPIDSPGDFRGPLPCETRTFELTGHGPTGPAGRYRDSDFVQVAGNAVTHDFQGELAYEEAPGSGRERRPIEHVRTLYRADDLTGLLPLGQAGRLALPGESYRLAFTPGMLAGIFERGGQALLPNPAAVLGGAGGNGGGYLSSQTLTADLRFPPSDPDGHWWIPSGTAFLSPNPADGPPQELAYARDHFFLPCRMRDPFHTVAASTESLVVYDAHDLLPVETRDAVGNRLTAGLRKPDGTLDPAVPGNDYRVLQPALVTDANRNRRAVAFDSLGLVVGTAAMSKAEEILGDSLAGFVADLAEAEVVAHLADPLDDPHTLLGNATTRLVYDLFAYHRTRQSADPQPPAVCTMAREIHAADLGPGEQTRVQQSFSYSDGFGREVQKKIQAEPGPLAGSLAETDPRWVGSGWTIFNNKGKPVRAYEPFFSATHGFEFGILAGVSPILFYDPVGRVVATLHPDHSYEKVAFDPWRQVGWDRNDTVLGDPRSDPDIAGYVAGHFAALGQGAAWQTWHAQRAGGALGTEAKAAAAKASDHAGTPTVAHFDTLGRTFLTVADNGPDPVDPKKRLLFESRVELDVEGNQRVVRDPVVQAADPLGRVVMRYAYDMLGHRIHQSSMEAGERWTLSDAAGKALRAWDSRGHDFATDYDVLRRPVRTRVAGADPSDASRVLLTDRIVYGEQHPAAEARNLRGKAWLHLDQAGVAGADLHDFKGNALSASRRLTGGKLYRQAMDWTAVDSDSAALPPSATAALDPLALEAALASFLEADTYVGSTAYDALNRPVELTTPHTPAMAANVIRPGFNEANLLERVDVNLRGALDKDGERVWTRFVADIDYDAKGQRERIDYGNKVSTVYEHDPLTHRLTRLVTRRDAGDFPADCPQPAAAGWPGCGVQDLRYTYDPVGNITRIDDRAQQAIFFANSRVEPSSDYVYDPLYRLIEATGREHLGQGGAPVAHSHDDGQRRNLPHPGDGSAMANYLESYVYDPVGNLLEMRHAVGNPVKPGWTRTYDYAEASLTEPAKTGNRLSSTGIGGGSADSYAHDAHGNMIAMPHLAGMDWNERDQLAHVGLGGGGEAFYVYDSAGQRVRKVWEKSANLVEERIYLAGFEIYRRRQGSDLLERETLHVMDDEQRIALVETRTVDSTGAEAAAAQRIRYQFANHLGSASFELDDGGQLVSYEEYSPFGSTTFQLAAGKSEVPKRFRYTAKERDEESGFAYHGARYYSPWLGRWTSADPAGLVDGPDLYVYVRNNPIKLHDPTGHQGQGPGKRHKNRHGHSDHFIANRARYFRRGPLQRFKAWLKGLKHSSKSSATVTPPVLGGTGGPGPEGTAFPTPSVTLPAAPSPTPPVVPNPSLISRTIRITGSPQQWQVYGTFNPQVETALADNWLSRSEITALNALPSYKSGAPTTDRDRLFRTLTGYYPGKRGPSPAKFADRLTYLSLAGYEDLPGRPTTAGMYVNRYIHWRSRAIIWSSFRSQALLSQMTTRMVNEVNAEPDIAPDDKCDLIRLQYLRLLVEGGMSIGSTGTFSLTVGGTTVGPLTNAQKDTFHRLEKLHQYQQLTNWANTLIPYTCP
jgi:RHS repeat-associated protein